MSNIFFISDHHFEHDNVYTFVNELGERIRPWAKDSSEGDQIMIESWNSIVGSNDLVYHLGDFTFDRKSAAIALQLNGKKILIRGNHDRLHVSEYMEYFDEVHGVFYKYGMVLSHFPVHPGSLAFKHRMNIHGHTHNKSVTKIVRGKEVLNTKYLNVSIESEYLGKFGLKPGQPMSLDLVRDPFKQLNLIK